MSKIKVFYEDWQYDCCGSYFSVGEYIWWPIAIGNYQKIINNKKRIIKYFCETHSDSVDKYVSGKVKKIEVIGGDKYIECRDTREIKDMGYSFIVTIDNVEEFLYKDIKYLNGVSNPFIKNKFLNEKNIYTKINIIGDLNNETLEIAKKFNENHFGINFYYKNKQHKEFYNELKNIRSYSTNQYYDLSLVNVKECIDYFTKALNIIICDKKDYTDFYKSLLKLQEEGFYSKLNICYIKINKYNYVIDFNYSKFKKNLFQKPKEDFPIKGIKIVDGKLIIKHYKKNIETKQQLIDFVYNKVYKNIKFINNKKRLLFFIILWIIIKIITFIVRY